MKNMRITKKTNIMVVDDQPGIRMLLHEVFEKQGYQVLTAESGNKALKLLREAHPQLVLLDINMPKMNGLELMDAMKSVKSDVKVMIMTAYEENELVRQALKNGAIAHFKKPFDLQKLIIAVEAECSQIA
ncbi:response regulator [Sporolactobacillus terrae]|uniref:Response regulator n=2 Tax=Sporolactobacillus terrae TaxID=269673 RepID=A0A5K7WZW2_9BACL|nr:response regulator [Sporolactobacillus terrae]